MKPKHTSIKILLCFLMEIGCVTGLLFSVFYPSEAEPPIKLTICILWLLLAFFLLYKLHCLTKRQSAFQKGIYAPRDLDEIDGQDFEALTCDILVANGFEMAENTQASVDYGVDVLARKNGITYAIQCKRYHEPVGIDAVQQVYAGRAYYECHVAVVLTNQYFTANAHKLADKIGVVLWDRDMLEELL